MAGADRIRPVAVRLQPVLQFGLSHRRHQRSRPLRGTSGAGDRRVPTILFSFERTAKERARIFASRSMPRGANERHRSLARQPAEQDYRIQVVSGGKAGGKVGGKAQLQIWQPSKRPSGAWSSSARITTFRCNNDPLHCNNKHIRRQGSQETQRQSNNKHCRRDSRMSLWFCSSLRFFASLASLRCDVVLMAE